MFELQIQYKQLEDHYKASVNCNSTNFAYKPVHLGPDIGKDEKKLPTSRQLLNYALKQPGYNKYLKAIITGDGFIVGQILIK